MAGVKETRSKRLKDGKGVSVTRLPRTVHFPCIKREGDWKTRVLGWHRQELGGAEEGSPQGPNSLSLFLSLPPKAGTEAKGGDIFQPSAIYNSNPEMEPGEEIENNLAKPVLCRLLLSLPTLLSYSILVICIFNCPSFPSLSVFCLSQILCLPLLLSVTFGIFLRLFLNITNVSACQ